MRFQFVSSFYDLIVKRMFYMVFYCNDDCLVHLVAYNLTNSRFSQVSFHGYTPF